MLLFDSLIGEDEKKKACLEQDKWLHLAVVFRAKRTQDTLVLEPQIQNRTSN